MIKQIMIPVAAFAVTVAGASAFTGSGWMENINLSDTERTAFEQVAEVREEARTEVDSILADAGIDDARMKEIREEMHNTRQAGREAMKAALEAGDYAAFLDAIAGTPHAEKITSEADFEKLVEVHVLMEAGDREGAKEILDELGIEGPHGGGHKDGKRGFGGTGHFGDRQQVEAS